MKKVFGLFLLVGLTISLVFGTQVFASNNAGENVELSQYSRSVTVTKYYSGNVVPPYSISYNSSGWSGTLYRTAYRYDGESTTLATYSGTVYCSGTCPLPY